MVRWSPCIPCELCCQPCNLQPICFMIAIIEAAVGFPPMILINQYFHKGGNYIFEFKHGSLNGTEIYNGSDGYEDQFTWAIKNVMGPTVTTDVEDRIAHLKRVLYFVGATAIIGGGVLIVGLCLEWLLKIITTLACFINCGFIIVHVSLTYGAIGAFNSLVKDISGYTSAFLDAVQNKPLQPNFPQKKKEILDKFTEHKDNVLLAGSLILIAVATLFLYFAIVALGYGLMLLCTPKVPVPAPSGAGSTHASKTTVKSDAGNASTAAGDGQPRANKDGENDPGNSKRISKDGSDPGSGADSKKNSA